MLEKLMLTMLAAGLVGLGWTAAKAQSSSPDFEFEVYAMGHGGSSASATIQCLRGCSLIWAERGVNPNSAPDKTFTFTCKGAGVETCDSGRIAGFLSR